MTEEMGYYNVGVTLKGEAYLAYARENENNPDRMNICEYSEYYDKLIAQFKIEGESNATHP